MDFEWKKVMATAGPSAALAFAAWRLLQLLEQRHDAAYKRYRDMVDAFRRGAAGKRREVIGDGSVTCHKRAMPMLHATNIGMMAAFLLLLSLTISTLDAVSRADWLKLFGAPLNMLRLVLVIPAAILIIMDNTLARKRRNAELAKPGEFNGRQQAAPARQLPERRVHDRRRSALLQPHGA